MLVKKEMVNRREEGRDREKEGRRGRERERSRSVVLQCSCGWQRRRPLETSRVSPARPSGFRK